MMTSDLFGAFANPLRLRILRLLQSQVQDHKEICVCDLCEVLGEPQPKISRHLAILRDARLVDVRSDGKWKFYCLAQPSSPLHRTLIRSLDRCSEEMAQFEADRLRLAGIEPRLRCA